MPPAPTTTGGADHLSRPSSPTPGHHPVLTPCKEQAHPIPPGSRKQGNLYDSLPTAIAGTPIEPCLNFLLGLLSISID